MNRRDFLNAATASITALTLPMAAAVGAPQNVQNLNNGLRGHRMKRYKEYQAIVHNNFRLRDAIEDIAATAANRISNFQDNFTNKKCFQDNFTNKKCIIRAYNLAVFGDGFYELICGSYDSRPIPVQELPADTMYRIETIKGKVVEFQQSKTGVDYAALTRPIETDDKSTSVRFLPCQIYHLKLGLTTFYPYGVSLIEPTTFYPYGVSLIEPIRKNPSASIGESAVKNFFTVFEKGMYHLKDFFQMM